MHPFGWKILVVALLSVSGIAAAENAPDPITISDLKRAKPVEFGTEIIPVFQKNCLPCHNATDAKGDLVLETPAAILKGGETGPAVAPGKSAESLLLKVAAHQTKPTMPPKNNKANAQALTSDELGLLKLWIDQGATGVVAKLPPVRWQNLAESFNPIQAVAITSDGQFAACSRGNQIDLYDVPTMQFAGSLIDPSLNAADHDLIESVAFSRDGKLLAAGGYRVVKIWRLEEMVARKLDTIPDAATNQLKIESKELKRAAEADDSAVVRLLNFEDRKVIAELRGDRRVQDELATQTRSLDFAKSEVVFGKSKLTEAEKQEKAEAEALKKVTEIKAAADKALADKNEAVRKANEAKAGAEKTLNDTKAAVAQATENKNLSDKLIEAAEAQSKSAAASAAEAAQILTRAEADREAAYAEVIALAKADKTAEAKTGIDRAVAVKLSFEHAQAAKASAEKAATEAAANVKSAGENKTKAEKTLADLTNQQKDADSKLKGAEKQVADADAAVKKADAAVKIAETNLQGTTAVEKKATENVAEAKKLVAVAEDIEKQAAAAVEAAKKRATDGEKKTRAVAFVGPWLAVGDEAGLVRFFSAETGRPGPVKNFQGAIRSLASTNSNELLVVAGETNSFALDTTPHWKLDRQIGDGSDKSPLADRVLALDFSADGKLLVTGGGMPSRSGELKIWNPADGSLVREIKDAHSDTIFAARFSSDQKYLATGAADKFMKVFEVATGKFVRSFEGHTHHVLNVSWMRHGRTLASAGADSAIKLWDFASGEQKKTIAGASREITALQFLDGVPEALAASGDNQLRLLREDGNNVRTYSGAADYTQSAAMTPDGRWLVAGGNDSQLRLWDGTKGDLLKTFAPPARAQKALANASARQ
jgi:WD40 repeat protein